jgi:hypothetical protein
MTMNHYKSILRTITPIGYMLPIKPKERAEAFNKWAEYIHQEVKKINKRYRK